MSGFSSLVNTAIGGVTSYDKNYRQAREDKIRKAKEDERYKLLVQKAKQSLNKGNQELSLNDQKIEGNSIKLNMTKDAIMKQSIDTTKKNFTDKFNSFIDVYKQHQGTLAKIVDGKKQYTIPTDLTESVQDMNKVLVHDPVGADWINHYLHTMDNPITNMHYQPETDEMILTKKNGETIPMSPAMMYGTLGLDKYSTWRHQKELEQVAAMSKALYAQHKDTLNVVKAKTSLQDSNTKVYEAETKRMKLKAEAEKLQLEFRTKANSKEAIHARLAKLHELSYEALQNPNVTKKDVKPLIDALKSNKDFEDTLKTNTIYGKVNKLKYFSDKSGEMSGELSKLVEGAKTGTMDTLNKMLLRFTGKGLNKVEYEKAQTFSTRMNLLIMDYLQYKSGAAFGAEELKGYQAAGGILNFNDSSMAKASVKGMATYLRNKLASDVKAVPNANQRLVLSYDAGLITNKSKLEEFKTLIDRDNQIKYLKDLKATNPNAYEALKQELINGK